MKPHILFSIAALLGSLAILFGAFGAHGLKEILTESQLHTYQTATEYLMYHSLALLGIAAMWHQKPANKGMGLAVLIMLLGVLLFAGSLYLLLFTSMGWLVWLTPLGGVLLALGWLLVAWQGLKMYKMT